MNIGYIVIIIAIIVGIFLIGLFIENKKRNPYKEGNKKIKWEKKHIIPKWLYYILEVFVVIGFIRLITRGLSWGTSEEKTFIIITLVSFFALIIEEIVVYMKKRNKK